MATAQVIIDRALRLISATASGESPTAQESTDGLISLNGMISSWQTEKLLVYAFVDTDFTMTPGLNGYEVGPSGDFDVLPRPPKLEQVYVRVNDIDYPVEMIDFARWNAIPDKTSESDIPMYAYYEPALDTGLLLLWPVPNAANELHIITWQSVLEFADLTTDYSLSPGYERALAYNLAIEISQEYQKQVLDVVMQTAVEAKATIKRVNIRPIRAYTELGKLVQGQRSNIYSGGYIA